jgi:hypothetical protein
VVTNIPAALRSEIEAVVESAKIQGRTDGPTMQRQVDAAVAALCAKVEALMRKAVREGYAEGYGYRASEYNESDPEDLPEAITAELLNEEPKDGDD